VDTYQSQWMRYRRLCIVWVGIFAGFVPITIGSAVLSMKLFHTEASIASRRRPAFSSHLINGSTTAFALDQKNRFLALHGANSKLYRNMALPPSINPGKTVHSSTIGQLRSQRQNKTNRYLLNPKARSPSEGKGQQNLYRRLKPVPRLQNTNPTQYLTALSPISPQHKPATQRYCLTNRS